MTTAENIVIRNIDFQHFQTLVGWAEKEGWNPGKYDAKIFWETDPDGFIGVFVENEMIGGGSIISYAGEFGFMGFFIVKPEYRASGIGRKLWYHRRNQLISRLKPGAAIGMDGILAMQQFYLQGGFQIAFRDVRYERIAQSFTTDNHIYPITEMDFPSVVAFDQICFGFTRTGFLQRWLQQPEAHTFKYMDDEGRLKGFTVMRKAVKGYRIGPLFAEDGGVAEQLYRSCLNAVPGEMVCIDIPMTNAAAVEIVEKYSTTYVFECARMYHGAAPLLPVNKIFGVTTYELG